MDGERERRRLNARCSFCGKGRDQVRKLVAGPGIYICDKCIQLCYEVLEEDRRSGPPPEKAGGQAWRTTSVTNRQSLWERLRRGLWRAAPVYR